MNHEHLLAITTHIQKAVQENQLVFCFYSTLSDIEAVCRTEGFSLQMPETCTVESFALQVTVPEQVPHLHFTFTHETPLELFCVQLEMHQRWLKRYWGRRQGPFRHPVVWLHESAFLLMFRMMWYMDLTTALAVHVQQGVCLPAEDYLYVQDKSLGRRPHFPEEVWKPILRDLSRQQLLQDLPPLTRAYLAQRHWMWLWDGDPRQRAELWLEAFQAYGQWQDTGNAALRRWWRFILADAHRFSLLTLDHAPEVSRKVYRALMEGPDRDPQEAFVLVNSLLEQAKTSGRAAGFLPFYFDLMAWTFRQQQFDPAWVVECGDQEGDFEPLRRDFSGSILNLLVQAAPLLEERHLMEHARMLKHLIEATLLQENRPTKGRIWRSIQQMLELGTAVLKRLIVLGSVQQRQHGQQLLDFARAQNAQDRLFSCLEEHEVPMSESWSGISNLPLVLLTEAIDQLQRDLEGQYSGLHLFDLGRLYEKRAQHQPTEELRLEDLRQAIRCAWEQDRIRKRRDNQHLGGGLRGWENIRVARFHFELREFREALFLINIGIQDLWLISQSIDHHPQRMKEELKTHLHFRQHIVQKLLEQDQADRTDLERILWDSQQTLNWLDHHELVQSKS